MKIRDKLQHTFALSKEGADDMIKACISVTVTNMSLMMTAGVLYTLIKDMLDDTLTKDRIPFYIIASLVVSYPHTRKAACEEQRLPRN